VRVGEEDRVKSRVLVPEGIMRKVANLSLILVFVLSVGAGCSSYSRTARTETVQEYPADERLREPVVVERRSEETTTETRGESGLLSGAVNVVGEALALPFRFVGGLISVIF
jgi:hypothetical protein